jgi:hypothetical protein
LVVHKAAIQRHATKAGNHNGPASQWFAYVMGMSLSMLVWQEDLQPPGPLSTGLPTETVDFRLLGDPVEPRGYRAAPGTVQPTMPGSMAAPLAIALPPIGQSVDIPRIAGISITLAVAEPGNSAEGFNDRVRRIVAGVFHHISPHHADLYFNGIGFRWSQRVLTGHAMRRIRKGREVVNSLWSRIAPALSCVQVSCRASIAPDPARQHPDSARRRCVWVIKAALSG